MADISKLKVGGTAYGIKDKTARDSVANLTPVIVTTNLVATSWSGTTYSLEKSYPNASYDLDVDINGDSCTAAQCKAWDAAQLKGSPTKNVLKAMGTVPTINIPIVIRYTKK